MSRIAKAFKGQKALISFVMAGDPDMATTEQNIEALIAGGSNLIEIGLPFSDPIAEGEVIEAANMRALEHQVTIDTVFELVRRLREKTEIPLVLLTYMNPIFVYGITAFCAKAAQFGLDGIIIPDIPFEEQSEVKDVAQRYGIALISLVAPTSFHRVSMIAAEAQGFIYLVSSMGVTGIRETEHFDVAALIAKIRETTATPIALGFGIATSEQVQSAAQSVDGVIIGSAIVRQIAEHKQAAPPILRAYIQALRQVLEQSQ